MAAQATPDSSLAPNTGQPRLLLPGQSPSHSGMHFKCGRGATPRWQPRQPQTQALRQTLASQGCCSLGNPPPTGACISNVGGGLHPGGSPGNPRLKPCAKHWPAKAAAPWAIPLPQGHAFQMWEGGYTPVAAQATPDSSLAPNTGQPRLLLPGQSPSHRGMHFKCGRGLAPDGIRPGNPRLKPCAKRWPAKAAAPGVIPPGGSNAPVPQTRRW